MERFHPERLRRPLNSRRRFPHSPNQPTPWPPEPLAKCCLLTSAPPRSPPNTRVPRPMKFLGGLPNVRACSFYRNRPHRVTPVQLRRPTSDLNTWPTSSRTLATPRLGNWSRRWTRGITRHPLTLVVVPETFLGVRTKLGEGSGLANSKKQAPPVPLQPSKIRRSHRAS
jgi:hypothetical protein